MTSPSSSLPPIEVGTRLTDYSSLDLTVEGSAEGGYGLVVWGPDQANGGLMRALKLLRPGLLARASAISAAEGERLRREFDREALTWCHLWAHANIISADFLTWLPGWGNLPTLILEYAPEGSLRQALSETHSSSTSHLSLKAALVWGQQIAAALAVIHQPDPAYERPEPLVHCDLKPENVLLNEQHWALLTDLGLTRAYAASPTAPAATGEARYAGEADSARSALGQAAEQEREARLARMRAALQAAGLLTVSPGDGAAAAFPPKAGATVKAGQGVQLRLQSRDAAFMTRSVRVPPLPAALLSTLLAPHPGEHTSGAAPQMGRATEPGIGGRGAVAGTPPYMPPEQWWGLDAVTPATDVYALGVLLFELFAGGRWSQQQQRWLDDANLAESGASSATERFVRFPHAPQFSAEALAYADGDAGGLAAQQAYFAAWYAAHRAGPQWRLADPAVGALTRGPLAGLADGRAQDAQVAQQALAALSTLVAECLAPEAARRPTAAAVQQRLGELARLVGQEPVVIPEVVSHTPEHEADFWENLALTYGNIGQPEESLRLQRRGVALDPEDPHRWMNLGVAYGDLKLHDEALAAYAEAERWLTPSYQAREPQRAARLALSIPNNHANALGSVGRYEEAVAAYRRVLALRPDKANTRFNLAVTLAQWSVQAGTTREQRRERLLAARQEIVQTLVDAPGYDKARSLLADIERDLAGLGGA